MPSWSFGLILSSDIKRIFSVGGLISMNKILSKYLCQTQICILLMSLFIEYHEDDDVMGLSSSLLTWIIFA